MKKIFRSILVIIIVCIIGILYISYITNHNQDELDNIAVNIQENYSIQEQITYANRYGNYYIFTTNNHIYVLNKEYEEVLKENISVLAPNPENLSLIYKTNQLMYEKTIREDHTITYEYYDAKTGESIKKTTLERK